MRFLTQSATRLLLAGSERANPILVRETRQSLKSRQFVATFSMLLAAAWMVSSFFMLWSGNALEYGAIAMELFLVFYVVLAFAIFVIVPFGAFRSLLSENELNTFDLLSITTLSPSRIVWGKLWTATVQVFIYYSAIAPFMAFTALLNGFDFAKFAFILMMSLLVSVALCMIALMFSTFARQKHWQALTSMGLLGGLFWIFIGSLTVAFQILWFAPPFNDPEFWWSLIASLVVVASYLTLSHQITRAQLTFDSDNRSSGIRIVGAVQVLIIILATTVVFVANSLRPTDEMMMVISTLSILHVGVLGLFAVTEFDALSRRIRRSLPSSLLLRVLYLPFLPGGARGLLYSTGLLALILTVCWIALNSFTGGYSGTALELNRIGISVPVAWSGLACGSLYLVIFMNVGNWLSRIGQRISSELRPAHSRVITVLVFMAGVLLPFLPRVMKWIPWGPYHPVDIFNPLLTLQHLSIPGAYAGRSLCVVAAMAVLSTLVNAPAVLRGCLDVIRDRVGRVVVESDYAAVQMDRDADSELAPQIPKPGLDS